MISKIVPGKGVRPLMNYLFQKDKYPEIIMSKHLCTDNKEIIIQNLYLQAQAKPDISRPLLHIPISFHQGDAERLNADPNLKLQIIQEYIAAMKLKGIDLTNTQILVVQHNDTKHPHAHLVVNKIDNGGNLIKDNWIALKSKSVCKEITLKHQLSIGNRNANKERLRGKDLLKQEVYEILKANHNQHLNDINKVLQRNHIRLELIKDENKKITGGFYSKEYKGKVYKIKASAIDKDFTLKKLLPPQQIKPYSPSKNPFIINNIFNGINDMLITDRKHTEIMFAKKMLDLIFFMLITALQKEHLRRTLEFPFTNPAERLKFFQQQPEFILQTALQKLSQADTSNEIEKQLQRFKMGYSFDKENNCMKIANGKTGYSLEVSKEMVDKVVAENNHSNQKDLDKALHSILTNEKVKTLKDVLHYFKYFDVAFFDSELNAVTMKALEKKPIDNLQNSQFVYKGMAVPFKNLDSQIQSRLNSLFDTKEAKLKKIISMNISKFDTPKKLFNFLLSNNIEVETKFDAKNNLVGIKFIDDTTEIKGSDVGYSAAQLNKYFQQKAVHKSQSDDFEME